MVELQYADDVAIVGANTIAFQNNLSDIEEAYTRAGLTINVNKTEAMFSGMVSDDAPTIHVRNEPLKNVATEFQVPLLSAEHCNQRRSSANWIGIWRTVLVVAEHEN